jgi:hypothetical protein
LLRQIFAMTRLLFFLTLGVALLLVLLVVLAPWAREQFAGRQRLLVLFADDVPVRRTALGCAAGLVVTAMVFFRSRPGQQRGGKPSRRPPQRNSIGA